MATTETPRAGWRLWRQRVMWLLVIWTLSVAALLLAAAAMRALMRLAGMSS